MERLVHTKTISDMLSIYSLRYSHMQDVAVAEKAREMLRLLLDRRIETEKGTGWGLNFPYATRFIDADTRTPNLYNTVNSLSSILDFYSVWPDGSIKSIAMSVADFILNDLGLVAEPDGCAWIRYYPGQRHPTFNVNALAAACFVKANLLLGQEVVSESIIHGLIDTLKKYQNPDGSWYYAVSDKGRWVDGFHTGFILESLAFVSFSAGERCRLQEVVTKALEFYRRMLFTSDGFPCYYPGHKYPVESQNSAQAIQTLANCSRFLGLSQKDDLRLLVDNVLHSLYHPDGYFYYKKGRYLTFKQVYLRWSQTPMILALIYASEVLGE